MTDWKKELRKLLQRMRKGGLGRKAEASSSRLIWCMDSEDDDGWGYVDESLIGFIQRLLNELEKSHNAKMREAIGNLEVQLMEFLDEMEACDENKSTEQWKHYNGVRNGIRDRISLSEKYNCELSPRAKRVKKQVEPVLNKLEKE